MAVLQAHGVIMVVSLVFLASISVAIAHSMRDTWGPRLWFQIHRGLNVSMTYILPDLSSITCPGR